MNMMKNREKQSCPCEVPATYRIRIQGVLDDQWSDCLGGMSITISEEEDHKMVTTLLGRLTDQADLVGVINTLYDLHRPILLVECLDEAQKKSRRMVMAR